MNLKRAIVRQRQREAVDVLNRKANRRWLVALLILGGLIILGNLLVLKFDSPFR